MGTVKNAVGCGIPREYTNQCSIFEGQYARKSECGRMAGKVVLILPDGAKLVSSLREATEKSGLKNDMTISFYHYLREGDYVLNMIIEEIAKMGIRNLKLVASSIANVHEPLIEYIESDVVTEIAGNGLHDKVGSTISRGLMEEPVVIRLHGGYTHAIEFDEIHIDTALLDALNTDPYGNADNSRDNATCGSLDYIKIDAKYADRVAVVTDHLVDYPNILISVPRTLVDYAVVVDAIDDPDGIAKDTTRFTSDPKELLITENTCKAITASPYFKDGISFQSSSGGSTLAITRFLAEKVRESGVIAGYPLGSITSDMVELLGEGLIRRILDTRTFDRNVVVSVARNGNHYRISTSFYVNPGGKSVAVNQLDVVMLSASGVDTDFNVNVTTDSDGVIRGASGGHNDTATDVELSLVPYPLLHGRIPTIVEQVSTVITPGEEIDVIVTEVGIAVNPRRGGLQEVLKSTEVNLFTMEELKSKAYALVGTPDPIEYGNKAVAPVEYHDGSLIDVVGQVKR